MCNTGSHLRSKQHKCLMQRKTLGSEKIQDELKWLHSTGMLYSSVSHSIHKHRSLLFVNNTEHSCYPFPMLSCALHLIYFLHLFLYYLHFNHFNKSSFLPPPVIWYISFLLPCNKLLGTKTMHFDYTTVSVGQKPMHGLAESSAQGFTRMQ